MKKLLLLLVLLTGAAFAQMTTTNLVALYEIGSGTSCSGACTAGATGSAWNDKSSNGNNLSVCSGNAGPTYRTNANNSLAAWEFNGTSNCFAFLTGINLTSASTIFVVIKLLSTAAGSHIVDANQSGGLAYWAAKGGPKEQGADKSLVAQLGAGTAAADATTWHQMNMTYNGTTATFRLDRAADGSTNTTATLTTGESWIGKDATGTGSFLNAQLQLVAIYNAVISGADQTSNESYINSTYFAGGAAAPTGFNKKQKLEKVDPS